MKYQEDARYLQFVGHVLSVEGGYSNNKRDRGGPTFRGVAWNYHGPWLRERFGLTDIRQLTREQALEFYYYKFWLGAGCHLLENDRFAYLHFDGAVNHGVGNAAKIFFRLTNKLGKDPRYFAGGHGQNVVFWCEVIMQYFAERLRFYGNDCKRDFDEFGRGWTTNRVPSIIEFSLKIEH